MSNKKLEISILNLSDIYKLDVTERIDSEYFQKKYLEMDEGKYSKVLHHYNDIKVKGGKRLPQGHDFVTEQGTPYIRAQEVRNSFVESSNAPLIEKSTFERLSRYKIENNDVLVTIVGNSIGDIGYAKNLPKDSVLTENAVAIRSKTIPQEVIFVYLMGKYGANYIKRNTVGTAQPKLSIERIKQFKYPKLSSLLCQKIVSLVNESFTFHKKYFSLYSRSELEILKLVGFDSINDVIKASQISVRRFTDIENNLRIDAEYYQPKYDYLIDLIKNQKFDSLENIVDIQKSVEPGSDYYEEEGIPFIRVADIDKFGIKKPKVYLSPEYFSQIISPKKNTILFSKDGTCGIAYKFDDTEKVITSSALLHLTKKNDISIDLDYLTLVLNSPIVQMQAERDAGGSILKHWGVSQIKRVLIPMLDKNSQHSLGNMVRESFMLREKSRELIKIAQLAVEIAIEEGEEKSYAYIEQST